MFVDFLNNCKAVLENERTDFERLKCEVDFLKPYIVFQPAITSEFFPMLLLEEDIGEMHLADVQKTHVYMIPIGGANWHGKEYFEKMIEDFYRYDILPDISDLGIDIELEQMLLLHCPDLETVFELGMQADSNIAYISLKMCNGKEVHLFLICATPEDTWKKIVERKFVKIDMLIDAYKGFGDFMFRTDFYRHLLQSPYTDLLPCFFMEGRYMRNQPDDSFELLQVQNTLGINHYVFRTPWDKQSSEAKSIVDHIHARCNMILNYRRQIEEYLDGKTNEPPVDAIRQMYVYLNNEIKTDGGESDFKDHSQYPRYRIPALHYEPSEQFKTRAELFVVSLLAKSFCRDALPSAAMLAEDMIAYYYWCSIFRDVCEKVIYEFSFLVYDKIKKMTHIKTVAFFIGANAQNNCFEESLLEIAFKKKDDSFADWLIENQFYGKMQPELFRIIHKYSPEKAAKVADRLDVSTIARILAFLCWNERGKVYISPAVPFLFSCISLETAEEVGKYIGTWKSRKIGIDIEKIYHDLLSEKR